MIGSPKKGVHIHQDEAGLRFVTAHTDLMPIKFHTPPENLPALRNNL
jgi:hypothetical protein